MKSFIVIVSFVILIWFLANLRNRAVNSVTAGQKELAAEREKAKSDGAGQQELDRISSPAPPPPKPADAADTTPIHFLATTAAGAYVPVTGPLTFHAAGPVRLTLEISLDAVAEDMPNPAQRPGEAPRPDLRVANTSFEVTIDGDGAARPAPVRAVCSLSPEPADLFVDMELGGTHDAMDAQSKKIYAQEIAGAIEQDEARRQLEALHEAYRPNRKGLYRVRALYRNGQMVSAPITVVITD